MSTGPVRRTVLDNGLRVVTEAMPGAQSLSLAVLVTCGSSEESEDERGLSHLCEHLVFQGTSTRDRLEIARQIDDAGGQIGAFTTRDYTCYSATVLGDYSYHALDLLGDLLLNPTFPEEALFSEKRAVLAEIARSADDPSRRAHDLLRTTVWPDHSLGLPITGTPQAVTGYSREDVIYFFHRNYTADRVILAAAGNLDHDDLVSQAQDAFWRMYGSRSGAGSRIAPPAFRGGVSRADHGSSQSYFCFAVPAPEYASPDRYAMHAMTRALGGNISSRLFRRLREELGLVYEISAEYHAYQGAGMISVEGSTEPRLLVKTVEEVARMCGELFGGTAPLTEDELWRVRTQIRSDHLISSESTHTRMMRLATQEAYFGQSLAPEQVIASIEELEPDSLAALARRLWGSGRPPSGLSLVGPELSAMPAEAAAEPYLEFSVAGLPTERRETWHLIQP